MFTSIPSLDSVLQCLLPVFTQPSFQTHIEVLLGWGILEATINPESATKAELCQLLDDLENYLNLAA